MAWMHKTRGSVRSLSALAMLTAMVGLFGLGQPSFAATAPSTGIPAQARANDGARVVAVQQVAPREIDLTISSPALGTTAPVRLLTPVGWDQRRPGQHWPTLWLLHGCCDSYVSWTRSMDLTAVPQLDHVLVVMPEAGTTGFYSNWQAPATDGITPADVTPRWETFHLSEVMQIVQRAYGASSDRAIAGLSMGGYGALAYAARHPGMFRAAASYSGVVDTTFPDGGVANVQSILTGAGDSADALWGDPSTDAAVWAAHNPYDLASRLTNIPVFLSCGNGQPGPLDPPGTGFSAFEALFSGENQALAQRLDALGDHHLVTDFYGPGTHSWPYWDRELLKSLPMLLTAMHVPSGA
jgi:S-formylglutathione hydrolase FrmB